MRKRSLAGSAARLPESTPALLPAPLRRPSAAIAAVAGLMLAVLAVRYRGQSDGAWLDDVLHSAVDADIVSFVNKLIFYSIILGDRTFVIIAALVVAAVCLALRQFKLAVLAVVGPGLTGLAAMLLKSLVGRSINGVLAFPSGHVSGLTAVVIVVLLLVWRLEKRLSRALSVALTLGLVAALAAMGVALTRFEIHYGTDVIGGFCLAIGVVPSLALLLDSLPLPLFSHWLRRRPGQSDAGLGESDQCM
jgi:membrane-associated phospholipid phosphatase